MSGELLAGITTAVIQTQSGASPSEVVGTAVGVVTLIGVLWAIVRFFLKPLIHNWLFAVLAHEIERFASCVVKALDHDEETKAIAKRFIDRLYVDKIATDQETRDMAETTRDRVVYLEESVKNLGASITRDVANAMQQIADSNRAHAVMVEKVTTQQNASLERISTELATLAKAYERLDERQQHYETTKRRR